MDVLTKIKLVEAKLKAILDKNGVVMPEVAIVLGSGLSDVADNVIDPLVISYDELADFPVATAPGHKGRFVVGNLGDTPVIIMQGRIHYYEGYPMTDVVLPVRVLARLGVKNFVLTNAVGGLADGMREGDLMLITDHISTFVPSPLIGPNIDELGLRFTDMTHVYDVGLQNVFREAADKLDIRLLEGVYAQFTGPQFETPTEIQLLKGLGIDVVGMSTVVEAIALRHMDIRVSGVSCITNLAAGISDELLCGSDVVDVGTEVGPTVTALISEAVRNF
ncbi:MAG: purine-nucleoside phosphorylase [Coriobacteriia bacterium]|nr:purine-nucleoside phosphorylase [Coriobacteriia bacterium]MCL2745521.1 purine-nucleoside phosphorylase [Coriobacteriia bacterium]MCL2870853.1 purine-nucleoside phosphorylase [Coriobacteriia bacterium]